MGIGGALAYAAAQDRLELQFLLMNGDSWINMDIASIGLQWQAAKRRDSALRA